MGVEGDGRLGRAVLPKAGVDLLVNVTSFLAFAGLAITGLFFMEDGHGRAKQLHELLGYLMVALVAVHVLRHWRWIASVAAGRLLGDASSRKRTWAALALATSVFVAIATATLLSGDRGENGHGRGSHRRAAHVDER